VEGEWSLRKYLFPLEVLSLWVMLAEIVLLLARYFWVTQIVVRDEARR
jgi:hypothetical protein